MGINVLGLCDGISCGQVALHRAGFTVDKYYSSEIEPNAISITQYNYPNTIQIGDIFDVNGYILPKIDLLLSGIPCTFWSGSKNHTAKSKRETTPDGDGWSLFEEFDRIRNETKPTYFLLENNNSISNEIRDEISKRLGVEPILIDSSLVSAQTRKRYYWTNIPNVTIPEDKGILFKDVAVYDTHLYKQDDRILKTLKVSKTGNYVKWDLSGKGYYSQQDRAYYGHVKAPTVPRCRTETKINLYINANTYKKTCPLECERLQTLPDNYTKYGRLEDGTIKEISKTRRFEAIGNCWTVDVIAHILSFIPKETN